MQKYNIISKLPLGCATRSALFLLLLAGLAQSASLAATAVKSQNNRMDDADVERLQSGLSPGHGDSSLRVAQTASPEPAADANPHLGEIRYISKTQVFLEQGREQGLRKGMILEVRRGDEVLGKLEVKRLSDHRASTVILESSRAFKVKDNVLLPAPLESPPPPRRKLKPHRAIRDALLAEHWQEALNKAPHRLQRFEKKEENKRARFVARAETSFTGVGAMGESNVGRLQQNVLLSARARDLGVQGLDVRIRGKLDVRYDSVTDRYQPETRAYPLFREAAVHYQAPRGGLRASAGRFVPRARSAELTDGAEVGWQAEHVGVIAYAGLKPDRVSLMPRADQQSYGVALKAEAGSTDAKWQGELGYLGDLGGGAVSRQAVGLDNRLRWGKLRLWQTATVDYLLSGRAVSGKTGIDLSDVTARTTYQLSKKIGIEASGRYYGRDPSTEMAAALPDGWIEANADRALARADVGSRIVLSEKRTIRPYVFWHEEWVPDETDQKVLAGGVGYHRSRLFNRSLSMDVMADYGDGSRQQANLQLYLASPLFSNRVQLMGGLMNYWAFGHESGMHTFQHLFNLRVMGEPLERMKVWALAQGAYDHDLASGPYLPNLWLQGELGVGYLW